MHNSIKDHDKLYKKIETFLTKKGAIKISIFGSYSRGDENKNSDIDILVVFSDRKSLFDLVEIEDQLEELIGIKVDLLTEKSISPYLIDDIRKEMVVIYG
ncbi:MAG: Nucleotidyltransferase domain protein [Candidatus Methanofastidiosum methylothiophilum]|uniref:protein adenylyltransferase n=1 Tax=Candidatus Methanofastidiosum methylothiophilum TaxID=1705564 RepID=A0A150J887_9EURY|nr:MAG: Nucleotidyltransferase domain protein [Candidatus Methanofastidiosum methylthiophilus]